MHRSHGSYFSRSSLVLGGVLVAALMVAERPADACIPIPDANAAAKMFGRRAVIWLDQASFSITFQNQSKVAAKDFAWVIPIPGVPTKVEGAESSFLDDLDAATTPLIEKSRCYIRCHNGPPDAGVTPGGSNVTPPNVTIWGGGKIGDLNYKILSSSNSADLVAWLKTNNYPVDPSLSLIVDSYVQDGWVFFAAKVAGDATAAEKDIAVPAVRFHFDRQTTPVKYPLRISAFGRTTALDTAIFVVSGDAPYKPKGYPVEVMDSSENYADTTAYQTAVVDLMKQNGGATFVVEYADKSFDWKRQQVVTALQYGAPKGDLETILTNNLYVTRLVARLEPAATTKDLELVKDTTLSVSGWYMTGCGPEGVKYENCTDAGTPLPDGGGTPPKVETNDDSGCSVSGATPLGAVALPLLLLGLAILRRRR